MGYSWWVRACATGACRGVLLVAVAVFSGGSASAAPLAGGFWGDAYGMVTAGMTGPLAKLLHKPAYQPIPCGGTNGVTLQKQQNGYSVGTGGSVASVGTVVSTLVTAKTNLLAEIHTTTTLTDVSLFSGLITASSIRAAANALGDAGLVYGGRDGSAFADLQIAGQPIDPGVAPGTVYPLPGIGTVAVGSTTVTKKAQSSLEVRVDMLVIEVATANAFGLPVGSRLLVGHAQGAFDRGSRNNTLGGSAWIGAATGELLEGPGFQPVSCNGTRGATRVADVTDFRLATLQVASGRTTIYSTTGSTGATVRNTSTLNGGSLLDGRISFDQIAMVAEDKFNGSTHVRATTGSSFTGLRVLGKAISTNVAPNTKLLLPGLGYVVVNDRRTPAAAVGGKFKVNGLRVVIDTANALGLTVGTELTVAHAEASTKP